MLFIPLLQQQYNICKYMKIILRVGRKTFITENHVYIAVCGSFEKKCDPLSVITNMYFQHQKIYFCVHYNITTIEW